MPPVWAYFKDFLPAGPSGPNQGNNTKCYLRRGDVKECLLYTHNDAKALIRHLHNDHKAEWKMDLAASRRSAHAKSQGAEVLVEVSGCAQHPLGRGSGS